MILSRRTVCLLPIVIALTTLSAFAQVEIWPTDLYKPPGDSCAVITVENGAYETVDFEFYAPWGGPDIWWGVPLDENGQYYLCIDEGWAEGQYDITGVLFWGSYYVPANATFYVNPAPPPANPPVVYALGPGCDNWDCVWATGIRFYPDSRVVVYSANWAYTQTYYGSAWQQWPPLDVNPEGTWLAFQVQDANLRQSFGWGGLYIMVVNNDGTNSGWQWVQSPGPTISSGVPSCADLYCVTFTGAFPLDAYLDFRVPGQSEILPNAYTDLVVTPSQITLRLNPSVHYAYNTSGLNSWVVNPAVFNWSAEYYLPPVDRNVTGHLDGIGGGGQQYYLSGWACAKTVAASIDVHVYVGGPAGGGGTLVFAGTANQWSEPAVAAACNSTGSNHRFYLAIPHWVTQNQAGQPIYVHGISPLGLPHLLIGNSGNVTVPGVDRSITGWVSGITVQGSDFYLYGWACAKTYPSSINVEAYVGGPAGSGTFAFSGTANQPSEPAIAEACNSTGANYRYSLQIPSPVVQQYAGQPIYVHGISPYGLPNLLLNGSGNIVVPSFTPTSLKEFIYLGDRVIAVESQ